MGAFDNLSAAGQYFLKNMADHNYNTRANILNPLAGKMRRVPHNFRTYNKVMTEKLGRFNPHWYDPNILAEVYGDVLQNFDQTFDPRFYSMYQPMLLNDALLGAVSENFGRDLAAISPMKFIEMSYPFEHPDKEVPIIDKYAKAFARGDRFRDIPSYNWDFWNDGRTRRAATEIFEDEMDQKLQGLTPFSYVPGGWQNYRSSQNANNIIMDDVWMHKHNGRHRMRALDSLGYDKVPLIIQNKQKPRGKHADPNFKPRSLKGLNNRTMYGETKRNMGPLESVLQLLSFGGAGILGANELAFQNNNF